MIRYSISGAIAFSIDMALLFILTEFTRCNYLVAAVISFSIGMLIVYLLSISWVFPNRSIKSRQKEIWIFVLIGVIGLGLNEVIIWSFTEFANFHYMASKLISTAIVYFWNFFNRKYLLFN
ncbi:MAG: GtrA family protein [Calditrichaceae bacterium]|nr:GtrA family protein [Calditrichaceae bacterium]